MPAERASYSWIDSRALWRALALALLAAAILYQAPVLLDHDVGWILSGASRMLDGARLYRDIVDPNPPAIFFLNLPPAWVARVSGFAAPAVFKTYVILLILASLWLSAAALRRALDSRLPELRGCFLVALAVMYLPEARFSFGQREHLMFLLAMPYALSAAAWAAGRPASPAFAVATGLMAGAGLAIKPHFLGLWILIEGYLVWTRGAKSLWIRRENRLIGGVQLLQILYIVLITPDYYRHVIPLARQSFENLGLLAMLRQNTTELCALALLLTVTIPSRPEWRDVRRLIALVCLAALAGAIVQQKGFAYHFYPARAAAILLFTVILLDLAVAIEGMERRLVRLSFAGMAVFTVMLLKDREAPRGVEIDPLIGVIQKHASGKSVVLYNIGVYPAFPTVNYAPARWTSRYSSLWWLRSLYRGAHAVGGGFPYHRPEQMGPAERYVFDGMTEDLLKDPPRLIMIHCHTRFVGHGESSFDLMEYLSQDPRVRALWADYQHLTTVHCIEVFQRVKT